MEIFKRRKPDLERNNRLEQRRRILQMRADEHNAKLELATQRREDAVNTMTDLFSERQDLYPIIPKISSVIDDIAYAERVEITGTWVTSFIEAEGDFLRAWDIVDQKLAEQRESRVRFLDNNFPNPES